MTILFCDIRSFSRISERLASPQAIIKFLIAFLTPMTDVLLARKATIDKYMGDAILAFWNAPLDVPDHERNAAFATLEMIAKLKAMNADPSLVRGAPWPGEIKIGVGMSTGRACVGNMGSEQRLNYSLIGDTVNLASRLEGLTKLYGVPAVINERLAGKIADFAVLEIDLVRVVGRDTPERVFALVEGPDVAASASFRAAAEAWSAVLAAYRARAFEGARSALDRFAPLADSQGLGKLAELYGKRIEAFIESPPGDAWDGVYEATEK
jgi:adenylate cyclase